MPVPPIRTCTVPPALSAAFGKFRAAGTTVDVIVQNPGSDTLAGGYTYDRPPPRNL